MPARTNQDRIVGWLQHAEVVRAIAQGDGDHVLSKSPVKAEELSDGQGLVIRPLEMMEEASFGDGQTTFLGGLSDPSFVRVLCRYHKGFLEFAHGGQGGHVPIKSGERGDFIDVHIGKSPQIPFQLFPNSLETPYNLGTGKPKGYFAEVAFSASPLGRGGKDPDRDENPSPVLTDEWALQPHPASEDFDLPTGLAADQDDRNLAPQALR
jgi:hypothetical protein